jgi:hypothetical protein
MHGGTHFTPENVAWIVKDYDFFISMGRFDANPTTLYETAAWGIIGACTTGSGSWANEPFWELRNDDLLFNLDQVDTWQHMESAELQARSTAMRHRMVQEHQWQPWLDRVWEQIEQWL